MKRLILIRHSKSSWETPLKDIDRPLSQRGIQNAHLISSQMVEKLPKSFIVWCSTARRTRETAIIFSERLLFSYDNIIFKEELYTFDERKLEEVIKNCGNQYDNLILFGHNDAITNFVNKFGNKIIENVPTSGVVTIEFDVENWKEIKKGHTVNILFPSHFKENHAV